MKRQSHTVRLEPLISESLYIALREWHLLLRGRTIAWGCVLEKAECSASGGVSLITETPGKCFDDGW